MKQIIFLLIYLAMTTEIFSQPVKTIELPLPQTSGGIALMDALRMRSSAREYSSKELTLQQLSSLLWAADGINRSESGKRTAPTAHNWQDIELYVIFQTGVYVYIPDKNQLILYKEGNFMKASGKQDFVANAALNLLIVSDLNKMTNADPEARKLYAGIHAGAVSQNIYLYCASEGLNTVTRRYFDEDELKRVLGFGNDKLIVLAQTVGFKP